MSLENYKLKQKLDTTTHLLGWWKSKTLITPNAGKDMQQEELLFIVGGNEKWYSQYKFFFVSLVEFACEAI